MTGDTVTRIGDAARASRDVELLGRPEDLARELSAFARDAAVLSSDRERLIELYEKQWVAIYDGEVRAHARGLPALLARVDRLGLPRARTIVRYIDRNERTMIL
ncbi:MAG: hypothetical protein ACYC9X_05655 [Dehalococcoidia bacterium]